MGPFFGTEVNIRVTQKNSIPYLRGGLQPSWLHSPKARNVLHMCNSTCTSEVQTLTSEAQHSRYIRGITPQDMFYWFALNFYITIPLSILVVPITNLHDYQQLETQVFPSLPTLLDLTLRRKVDTFSSLFLSCMGNIPILHTSTYCRQSPWRSLVEALESCL